MRKIVPRTNLVPHQSLLDWYQEISKLQNQERVLCPLMMRVPGEYSAHLCHCDIPRTRKKYLQRLPSCIQAEQCLPRRKKISRLARQELYGEPAPSRASPLFGKGYSKHAEDCVVCMAGRWDRCYLEYGDDPRIKLVISSNIIIMDSYHDLVVKLRAL